MDGIIAEIKARLKIEDLVAKTYTVEGRGRVLTTKEHDSLKLWPATGRWWWFSRNLGGDVIDWQRHVHRCDLAAAIDALAHQAGIERRPPTPAEVEQRHAEQTRRAVFGLAANWFARQLQAPVGGQARDYCAGRGWTPETIQREGIGYNPPAHNNALADDGGLPPLANELRKAGLLDHPAAQAVLSLPGDMLVYAHRDHGATVYLSARSVEGKRHWNLPADLAGGKRLYANTRRTGQGAPAAHLLVEGQADAVSLGQIGIEATALCGLAGDDLAALGITHVALDNDAAGQAKAIDLAMQLDPLTKVVVWPERIRGRAPDQQQIAIKDAADLLRGEFGTAELAALLADADGALVCLARKTHRTKGEERRQLLDHFFRVYTGLDDVLSTDLRPELADALCGGLSQFNRLLKAHKKQHAEAEPVVDLSQAKYSMGGYIGGTLFEQCIKFLPNGAIETFYWVRQPDGKRERKQTLDIAGTTYVPYSPQIEQVLSKRTVLLPADLVEYGSERQLLDETRAFIHRWVDVDVFYEQLAAYYVFLTWVYDAFYLVPYLRAIGDTGTGKTRLMWTVGSICYRPMFLSGATSEASLFHLLDMARGTMILDEADFSNSGFGALITKILNIGNSRYNNILRVQSKPDGSYGLVAYDVYTPKCIAGRALFEDRAVESRCLVYRTVGRRVRADVKRNLNDEFYAEATALRNKFLAYRFKHFQPEIEIPDGLSDSSIEARLDQVSMPIKAIIKDPEMLTQLTEFVRAYNQRLIVDRQLTTEAILVQALANIYYLPEQTLMGERCDLSVQNIYDQVVKLMGEFDMDEKLSPRKIGALLIGAGLPDRERKHDGRRYVVLPEPVLESLMVRYGIEKPTR